MHELKEVGKIGKPHGIKGMLTLHLDVEVDWHNLKAIFIEKNEVPVPYIIEDKKILPTKILVKLENISSIDEAKKITNRKVWVHEKFLIHELSLNYIDYSVLDVNNKNILIGKVIDWIVQGNMEWLILKNTQQKEIILPFNSELVQSIDDDDKIIYYKAVEGMY